MTHLAKSTAYYSFVRLLLRGLLCIGQSVVVQVQCVVQQAFEARIVVESGSSLKAFMILMASDLSTQLKSAEALRVRVSDWLATI